MLHQWIRVFFGDNGTLTDNSIEAQADSGTVTAAMVAAEDYIYVAQYFPFNNFFIEIDTANSNASVMTVQTWNGTAWKDTKDLIDATKVAGATLAQNGVVQFHPDREESWLVVSDTSDSGEPTDLSSLNVYELYWARIKVSADLSAGTDFKKLGYKFTDDQMLDAIDPELDKYQASWESGKTDWNEQIMIASQHVVFDLKSQGLIVHAGDVLRFDDVSFATAYRTMVMIYSTLGEGFNSHREHALTEYKKLMGGKAFTFDSNQDGQVTKSEIFSSSGKLVR